MIYSIYETLTGEIRHTFNGPESALVANTPDGCSAILGDYDNVAYVVDLETHQPVAKPLPEPDANEQWGRIRKIRDELRDAPVTLGDGWGVDADPDSIDTMKERIEKWGIGTATMTPDGRQMWKGADNDVRYFTQSQFTEFVDAVRNARAVKVDANFAYAELIRSQLPISENHSAFDPANWPG